MTIKERTTPIRTTLLKIMTKIKRPLTTQELLKALETNGLKANKTTIYRQLESLKENNLVNEVHFNDRTIRYELKIANTHHHHLVCLKCKKIEDVTLPEDLHHQEEMLFEKNNFKVLQHFLEFFGLCKNCQK